ncbi:WhiB family transcriptional regulator [Candidatus Nanosynbacter sp. BB002]|jgi:hypothetical protein|uniref:WhiB family transcriptional regulator n=1 Tax=Candidatus Nanosynbacter sp. BB002 TaxID=3393757 RepID=UPI0030CD6300
MNELGKTSMETTASLEDLKAVQNFIIDCLADGQSMTVPQLSQQWCEAHGSKSLIKAGLFNETIRQALSEIEAEEDGSFECLKKTVVQDTNTTVTYYHLSGASEGYQPAVMEPVNSERFVPPLQAAINEVVGNHDAVNPDWDMRKLCAKRAVGTFTTKLCEKCPVKTDCLKTALAEEARFSTKDVKTLGVKGGYAPRDRLGLLKEIKEKIHETDQKS